MESKPEISSPSQSEPQTPSSPNATEKKETEIFSVLGIDLGTRFVKAAIAFSNDEPHILPK